MMSLADWQATLTGAIDSERPRSVAPGTLAEVPGPTPEQGCSVYRNNSRGARSDALVDVYPVCRRLLGERCFAGLARGFVQRTPSMQGDLNRFGGDFAGFVEETAAGHEGFAELPWLGDLVRLEWLCHSLYYVDDEPPLDLEPLHATDPASLCPRPAKRLAWMHSRWPVHEVWAVHRGADEPPPMQLCRADCYLVIERQDYQAQIRVVDVAIWALLEACACGLSIAEMADEPALDVGRLGELVERRWIGALAQRQHRV